MVYRLVRFNLGSGKLDAARNIFTDLVPKISAQPGCQGVTAFGDEASGDYGMAVLWGAAETHLAGESVNFTQLFEALCAKNTAIKPLFHQIFGGLEFLLKIHNS